MTKVREKITGIYKIESPSGSIYIGQSVNILKRWNDYYKIANLIRQKRLFNSFNKHSPESHTFSILCRLPNDVSPTVLCTYEQFCIDQYKEAGFDMMNIRDAGSRGSHSAETKKLMSEKQKGRKHTPETLLKLSAAKKGKPGIRLGAKLTPEQIERMKGSRGFKHSEETKIKIKNNHARFNKGRKFSDEFKEKNRIGHLGKKASEETKRKISAALKGKAKSKEHNQKVSVALIKYHSEKRLLSN